MAAVLKKKSTRVVASIKGGLETLVACSDLTSKAAVKARDDVSKGLPVLTALFDGEEPLDDGVALLEHLEAELFQHELLELLMEALTLIDFEARKDVVGLFRALLPRQDAGGTRLPVVEYLSQHDGMLETLLLGYGNADIALVCGRLLRECIVYPIVCEQVLQSDAFMTLVDSMEDTAFDVATDAFLTLGQVLSRHSALASEFLDRNFEPFFGRFCAVLESDNYVARRQALSLLLLLLLDRANLGVMLRFIAVVDHLRIVMSLLCDRSRAIQFDAFKLFKIFVASPIDGPPEIQRLLRRNANKLVSFMTDFLKDRREDEAFLEEKAFIINKIQTLGTRTD